MTMITIGSVCGAPGATTLAMGVAAVWPARDVPPAVIEADPDGGRLGAELGVGVEPGLVSMSLAARAHELSAAELLAEGGAVIGDWSLIPGPPSAEQAWAVLTRSSPLLARAFASCESLVVVDAGRLPTRSPAMPLAMASDVVLLVSHGSFPALQLVPSRVSALAVAGCRVGLAVSGATSWNADEIAAFAGCDVMAMLPGVRIRRAARSMSGSEWGRWWTAVRDLATYLHAFTATAVASPAVEAGP